MSVCRETYIGDSAFETLIQKHGGGDLASIRALMAGVNAASVDMEDADWTRLFATAPSPALTAQLQALRQAMALQPWQGSHADRLTAVRKQMARQDLTGFLVPRADEHQGEYVPPRAQRLKWLTGFEGSAGLAVVLTDRAAIFVDGRYTLQVRQQVDTALFEPRHLIEAPAPDWLADLARDGVLKAGQRIGYDPWLLTTDQVERFRAALDGTGVEMVAVAENPLDAAWQDQPPAPLGPVRVQPDAATGQSSAAKRAALAEQLTGKAIDATLITQPDSLAWLLNIRGTDVPRTPFALGFCLLNQDGSVDLFMDDRKLLPEVQAHLGNSVRLHAPSALTGHLATLKGKRVLCDTAWVPSALVDVLTGAGAAVVRGADPCLLPKACKNPVELAGSRAAHIRDGAAIARFLAWLAAEAPKGKLREIEVSDYLEACRRATGLLRDLSFDTISGAGPNGAIVHYRATPETERTLTPGELYLVDSGAQYVDGTTDITRTIAVGSPSTEQRQAFTRVLKGHIALTRAVFPAGTTGSQLDVLARLPLWDAGLDYDHGTGHGVGSYLSVHEGPQRIAKAPNSVALKPGMILSNEPGYYKTGAYGIRIENLVAVIPMQIDGAEREMLGFETLTLAPIDRALIDPGLLTEAERDWLNAYHAQVRETISPLVDSETAAWLAGATAPV